jgi:flagellar assembly protein FliH
MIIKKQKASPVSSNNPTSQNNPQEKEFVWDPFSFEEGGAEDRRNKDRRRGYRRQEDRETIASAHQEADRIREQARQEGLQQGLYQAQDEIRKLQEQLQNLLVSRNEALMSLVQDNPPVAIEVAQRIIKTEVSSDETLVVQMARDVVQKAGRTAKTILVKVNSMDIQAVKQSLTNDPIPNMKAELMFQEDDSVETGSCLVETNSGLIDACFHTQFALLKTVFGLNQETDSEMDILEKDVSSKTLLEEDNPEGW